MGSADRDPEHRTVSNDGPMPKPWMNVQHFLFFEMALGLAILILLVLVQA